MEATYHQYRRRTNYYETDRMGIIHHSNYIRYFEEARLDWMEQMGLDYRTVEELGILIPVMFVNCQYLVPVRFGDEIGIQVSLTKFDGIKMEFAYELYQAESGKLCTTGCSGHCFLNGELKPFRLKKQFPDIYEKMKDALSKQ